MNEALAPKALACIRDFKMGTTPCAYALRRTRKRYGVVTMCIGGGQGIALVLEEA